METKISNDDSHKGSVSQPGVVAGQKSKGSRGHCDRFWWVYLVLIVVTVVIVVPCILLVAVPRMAQARLNNASLNIDSIVISQPEKDSFHMAINSTIQAANGGAHATIRAFEGDMYLLPEDGSAPSTAFAKFQFPEVVSSSEVMVNVSQKVAVADADSLIRFNEALLSRESVRVRIQGDTQVRVRGISREYPVTFAKDMEFKAFNGFAGLSVSDINVTLAKTNNFHGTVHIPNPTIFSFEIGNTTWNNYLDGGANVGTAYIQNLVMRPGANAFPLSADITQGPVLAALGKKPVCEDPQGPLTFQLSGKTVEDGGQLIPWLGTALAAHNASVTMPVGAAVAKTLKAPIPCSKN